jgi:hypothetical protein
MKKNVIILLLLIQSINFSQNLLRYNIVNVSLYDEIVYSQRDKIKEQNIAKVETYELNKKNENVLKKESLLDSSSAIISQFSLLNKKKINYSHLSKYQDRTILERSYGRNSYKTVYDFVFLDSNKKFMDTKRIFINNRLASTSKMFRQNEGKIDSIYFFIKQKKIPSSKLYFSYKNGKIYETKLYKKGKLKRIQKYNCNPIGEKLKKVQQTQECRNTEIDSNGNEIKVYVTTNDKGQEEKRKITISKVTDKIIKHERFNFKNQRTFYWEDLGDSKITINYNSRGKETYRENNFYDNENRITKKETFWKKKPQFSNVYIYNEKVLIQSSVSTNSKGKTITNYYRYK